MARDRWLSVLPDIAWLMICLMCRARFSHLALDTVDDAQRIGVTADGADKGRVAKGRPDSTHQHDRRQRRTDKIVAEAAADGLHRLADVGTVGNQDGGCRPPAVGVPEQIDSIKAGPVAQDRADQSNVDPAKARQTFDLVHGCGPRKAEVKATLGQHHGDAVAFSITVDGNQDSAGRLVFRTGINPPIWRTWHFLNHVLHLGLYG